MSLLAVATGWTLLGSPVAEASPATFSVQTALMQMSEDAGDAGEAADADAQAESAESDVAAEVEYLFDFEISTPVSEAPVDLSCARGCVLEYHACMWSEWSMSCDLSLNSCSETCN